MANLFDRFTAVGGAILAFGASASLVYAEKLDSYWQEQRDHYNYLSDEACVGNAEAHNELILAVHKDNNPVAKVDLAWLSITERCGQYDGDEVYATKLNGEAARDGYPIGQSNYAARLLKGQGIEKNTALADTFYRRAMDNGYGNAAAHYAEHLAQGIHITSSLSEARALYERAVNLGADQSALDDVVNAFAEAGESLTSASSPATQSNSWRYSEGEAVYFYYDNGDLSAAVFLGVDEDTGGYYFGFARNSDNIMIHFMGATVEDSAGQEFEIDAGGCYGNSCLYEYSDMGGFSGNQIRMSIQRGQEAATLEALKAGKDITFRYQTVASAANDNFLRFVLNLNGSRGAIEELERDAKRRSTTPLGSTGALPVPRND